MPPSKARPGSTKSGLSSLTLSQAASLLLAGILLVTVHTLTHATVHAPGAEGTNLRATELHRYTQLIALNTAEITQLQATLAALNAPPPAQGAAAPDMSQWITAVAERDEIITTLQKEAVVRNAKLEGVREAGQRTLDKAKSYKASGVTQPYPPPPATSIPTQQLPAHQQPSTSNPPAIASNPPAVPLQADSNADSFAGTTTLLIFTYQRADYLTRTLDKIMEHVFPGMEIVISQDGDDVSMKKVIDDYTKLFARNTVRRVEHTQKAGENGYQKLSQHYGFGLTNAFETATTGRVIVLEEDIEIAPDFFTFFRAMAPFLHDPAEELLCVSAWNDNGMKGYVADREKVVRSDFFPGLGWMVTREVYEGLLPWPRGYWDDWLREPQQRRGRKTLRPEISR